VTEAEVRALTLPAPAALPLKVPETLGETLPSPLALMKAEPAMEPVLLVDTVPVTVPLGEAVPSCWEVEGLAQLLGAS